MNWWRLWVGIQMGRAARAVEFFALGIMRPADLIELNRRYFMRRTRTSTSTHVGNFDLGEEEATIVNRFSPRPGSALILGCGVCLTNGAVLAKYIGWISLTALGSSASAGRGSEGRRGGGPRYILL